MLEAPDARKGPRALVRRLWRSWLADYSRAAYPVSGPKGRHRNGSQASDNPERYSSAIARWPGLWC